MELSRTCRTTSARLLAVGLALWLAAAPAVASDFGQAASLYRSGKYERALEILQPMAASGDPYAQFTIGVMYDDGRGVPKNLKLAHHWYLRAARGGLADAQFMAGMFYAVGRGRPQDVERAYIWLDLAAAGGYPDAERARDQEMGEMTPAELHRAQAAAVRMQRQQPRQSNCRAQGCVHPSWMDNPRYELFVIN
jgi:hypothetical protein